MDELVRVVVGSFGITSFGGIGIVTVLALLALLVLILPERTRPKARLCTAQSGPSWRKSSAC